MATSTVVLYARISEPAHTGIQEVADLAGLSSAKVHDAIACITLGLESPHTAAVRTAVKRWKQGERAT